MFQKLKRKLFLTIFLIPSVFMLVLSTSLVGSLIYIFDEDFHNNVETNIQLVTENIKFRLELLSSNPLSTCPLLEALPVDQQSDQLSQIQGANELFMGVTYYSADKTVVSSSFIGGVKSYEEMISDTNVSNFYVSDKTYTYLIRTKGVPNNYGYVPHNEELGMLTLVVKADSGGLLLVDISKEVFYDQIMDFSDYQYFNNYTAYLTDSNETILKREVNNSIDFNINSNALKESKKSYNILQSIGTDNLSLYVSIPSENLRNNYLLVIIPTIATNIISIILFGFIARHFSNRKMKKLTALQESMQTENPRL